LDRRRGLDEEALDGSHSPNETKRCLEVNNASQKESSLMLAAQKAR